MTSIPVSELHALHEERLLQSRLLVGHGALLQQSMSALRQEMRDKLSHARRAIEQCALLRAELALRQGRVPGAVAAP